MAAPCSVSLTPAKEPQYSLRAQRGYGILEEINSFASDGIGTADRPGRSLVSVPTELSRILVYTNK